MKNFRAQQSDRGRHFSWEDGDLDFTREGGYGIDHELIRRLAKWRLQRRRRIDEDISAELINPHFRNEIHDESGRKIGRDTPAEAPSHLRNIKSVFVRHPNELGVFSPKEYENQLKHRATFDHDMIEAHSHYKFDGRDFNLPLRDETRHLPDGRISTSTVVGPDHRFHSTELTKLNKSRLADVERIVSHPTKMPIRVFRGFGAKFNLHKAAPGAEFIDHGFTGTTIKFSSAHSFAGAHPVVHGSMRNLRSVAIIDVPAGTRGHLLDHPEHESPLMGEDEFLLHRGTKFRVKEHKLFTMNHFQDPVHVVHLDVIGQHPKPLYDHEEDR